MEIKTRYVINKKPLVHEWQSSGVHTFLLKCLELSFLTSGLIACMLVKVPAAFLLDNLLPKIGI